MHRNCSFWYARKVVAFLRELRQALMFRRIRNSSAPRLRSAVLGDVALSLRSPRLTATLRKVPQLGTFPKFNFQLCSVKFCGLPHQKTSDNSDVNKILKITK